MGRFVKKKEECGGFALLDIKTYHDILIIKNMPVLKESRSKVYDKGIISKHLEKIDDLITGVGHYRKYIKLDPT